MDLESESVGIRVRGDGGEEVISEDEEELTEPNVTGTGMLPEDLTRMIREAMRDGVPHLTPPPARKYVPPVTMETTSNGGIYYDVNSARQVGEEGVYTDVA
jgi:hypothetical protein